MGVPDAKKYIILTSDGLRIMAVSVYLLFQSGNHFGRFKTGSRWTNRSYIVVTLFVVPMTAFFRWCRATGNRD